ncbi:uncharacterized protein LOC135379129 [Ornithodoros turicata]|uniref:uncharacterized protein LOC135379129 n=1 Tax=Ornithodoros turicata TaxID=34597 RepID=UPI003139FA21
MAYILVKWVAEETWDVYPIRNLVDVKTATQIARKPSSVTGFTGKVFDVKWRETEEPSPAYLVAAGEERRMEKLRSELADQSLAESHEPTTPSRAERVPGDNAHEDNPVMTLEVHQKNRCCEHKAQVKRLRKEKLRLEARLAEAEARQGAEKMVKRLDRILRNFQGNGSAPAEEDIGNGVFVNKSVLDRLYNTFRTDACKFARNLMRSLFDTEELRNRSLYGIASNVKKGAPIKPAVDRKRLDAILNYTSSKYGAPAGVIKKSLASLLLELSH